MITRGKTVMPYMKSLAACLRKVQLQGYTERFKPTEHGMIHVQSQKQYGMEQVNVITLLRFTGNAGPDEHATLCVIETTDGLKGTMIKVDA